MATDEAKKLNALRMTTLSLQVLAAEVWDTLGDSSMALANGMGDALLEMLEKEQGLEIAGEGPAVIGTEINRILVDEYGYANEISMIVDGTSDNPSGAVVSVKGCINTANTDKLLKAGVKIPFICPMMLIGNALLRRVGMNVRINIERWPEGKGCKIHYKVV